MLQQIGIVLRDAVGEFGGERGPGQPLQRVLRRAARHHDLVGILVARARASEKVQRSAMSALARTASGKAREAPLHLLRALEIAVGEALAAEAEFVDRDMLADRGDHVLEHALVGAVVEDVAGGEARRLHALDALARRYGVRSLATGDVLYDSPTSACSTMSSPRSASICTIDDLGFRRERYADRYLKSPEEMERRFRDFPDAIRATADIAERCTFSYANSAINIPTKS